MKTGKIESKAYVTSETIVPHLTSYCHSTVKTRHLVLHDLHEIAVCTRYPVKNDFSRITTV